jgi:LemA protein
MSDLRIQYQEEMVGAGHPTKPDTLNRLALVETDLDGHGKLRFLKLQTELINTENRIQAARRFYNGNVRDYRNKCETFPSNLVASLFGFQPHEFFSVPPSVAEVPIVEFGN